MNNKRAVYFIFIIGLLFILLIPGFSYAQVAGNYFVNIRSVNDETVISTPTRDDYTSRIAEISVQYDAQDHGFSFSCLSCSINSCKYVSQADVIQECKAINERGEEVPFQLNDSSDNKTVYLVKPAAGTYTITIIGRWSSGSISGEAGLTVTMTVEKGNLEDCLNITPYSGTYDGTYHNAIEIVPNQEFGDYFVEYKEPDSEEYVSALPLVKDVSSSGTYRYRISTENESFINGVITGSVNVEIKRKSAVIAAQAAAKCKGDTDPVFDYVVTGLTEYDELDYVLLKRTDGETPGQYLIKASQPNGENANYIFSYTNAYLTIRNHSWGNATYTWAEDNSTVTAKHVCSYNSAHIEEETVSIHSEVTKEPTCTVNGYTTYTSDAFTKDGFTVQSKKLQDINALGHAWNDPTYNWVSKIFVTATRTCLHDSSHKETETVAVSSSIAQPATCETKGRTTYTTAAFKNTAFSVQSQTLDDIAALGHIWENPIYTWSDDYSEVRASHICSRDASHCETETVAVANVEEQELNCTQDQKTIYTSADFANKFFTSQTKEIVHQSAPGHKKIIDEPAVEPSCLFSGHSEQSHCEVCGTILSQRKVISSKGHVKVIDVAAKEATCIENGYTEKSHCSVCGITISAQTHIPAKGHTIVIDSSISPTTSKEGLTEGSHCSICGAVIKKQNTIAKLSGELELAPCIKLKLINSIDSSDSSLYGTTYEISGDPSQTITIVNPKNDSTLSTTQQIKKRFSDTGINVLGTQRVKTIDNEGSIVDGSSTELVYGYDQNNSIFLGHIGFYKNGVYYETVITCKVSDGSSLFLKYVNNIFARHESLIYDQKHVDATCTSDGKTEGVHCASCNEVISVSQVIPKIGHSLTKIPSVLATCTTNGYEAYWNCSLCRKMFSDSAGKNIIRNPIAIPQTGHSWSTVSYSWSEDNATVTATRKCNHNSRHIESQTSYTTVGIKKVPTCTENGEKACYCASFTNPAFEIQSKTVEIMPAIGHKWAEPIYQWDDDNSTVTASRICLNDNEHIEEETVSTSLKYTIHPTCLEAGKGDYTSSTFVNSAFQIQIKKDAEIKPLGHEWGSSLYEWSDDYSYVTASHTCIRDNSHREEERAITVTQNIKSTCLDPGMNIYTAEFHNLSFESQRKEIITESASGHAWSDVQYCWNDDYTQLTATRICLKNAEHTETETVSVLSSITKQPTCEEKGETTYISAEFTNKAFSVQTKVLTNIECIGHEWSEPIYEWKAGHTYVIARRVCNHNPEHVETETEKPTVVIHAPTESEPGIAFYQAEFENSAFNKTNKTVEIPALKNLAFLELPSNLKTINEEAFLGTKCQVVIIPDSCQTIGYKAFANCTELLYVRIPETVTYVDDHAFDNSECAVIDIVK